MHIIKLDAIESTNTFLKELVTNQVVENYTVVTAETQFSGRGQMGAKWISEPGKNLLFSVFVKDLSLLVEHAVYLNYAISIAIYNSLSQFIVGNLNIKWPNDILAGNKKICGILVENTLNNQLIKNTIIGVGLNVNQELFPNELTNVTSLKNISSNSVDREKLLESILLNIQIELKKCNPEGFLYLKEKYLSNLYKMNTPTMFQNEVDGIFIGKIIGVNSKGEIQIELEDESIKNFGLKEVKFLR